MALTDFAIGTLLSVAAAIVFGVQTSFSRVKTNKQMTIYNVYYLFGSAITCFIEYIIMLALGETIHFTYLGIIAAFLLLCFIEFYLLSTQKIGLGFATGFTVFSACTTAPIAQFILNQPVKYWYFMVVGLFFLALSVFMIFMLKDIFIWFGIINPNSFPSEKLIIASGELPLLTTVFSGAIVTANSDSSESFPLFTPIPEQQIKCGCDLLLGLLFASVAGICMDLLPFPSLYAAENSRGLKFFLSFGIGCIVVMPLCAVMIIFDENKIYKNNIYLLRQLCKFDDEIWSYNHGVKVLKCIIPAVTTGIIWSIGNICCFLSFLYLNYTIAVSFVQCQVIVALFFRVFVWREISNQIELASLLFFSLFFLCGCVIVVYGSFGHFDHLIH